jgi:hypothetical protein
MKKIICAALALTLLGSTAAQASDWGHGWHGGGWHHHGNADWAVGLGLGLFALGVIGAAESAHERNQYYRDRDAYDRNQDYPPPGYDNRGGGYGDRSYEGYDDRGAYDNRNGYDDNYGPPDNGRPHQEDEGGY